MAISEEGDPVGILSDTDIIKVLNENISKISVKDVMTSPIITTEKDAFISKIWEQMESNNIHCSVVLQEISTTDTLQKNVLLTESFPISDIIKAMRKNS